MDLSFDLNSFQTGYLNNLDHSIFLHMKNIVIHFFQDKRNYEELVLSIYIHINI